MPEKIEETLKRLTNLDDAAIAAVLRIYHPEQLAWAARRAEATVPWADAETVDDTNPWDYRFEQMSYEDYEGWCEFFLCDYPHSDAFENALADCFTVIEGGDSFDGVVLIGEW